MISAKIIADSISENGDRITTFELEYPRFIHSELMTHRLFSRNAASSRAIPVGKMIEQVYNNPTRPIHWGKNKAGMQADEELIGESLFGVKICWARAAERAAELAEHMVSEGAHKQIVNRLLEPFQWMKTVVTATEFDNFFWLRCHKDAQPEIKVLSDKMKEALENSTPNRLNYGEWHLPYVITWKLKDKQVYSIRTNIGQERFITLEQAKKLSASCCAQVSYRQLDDSLEKAEQIYDRLVNSVPVHASPFEHQATPIKDKYNPALGIKDWEKGVTHVDNNGNFWSGNFKSWIQNRQLIENNVCWDYEEEIK